MKIFQIRPSMKDIIPYAFLSTDEKSGSYVQMEFYRASLKRKVSIEEGFIPPFIFKDGSYKWSASSETPDIDEINGSDCILFSIRAQEALSIMLDSDGELLPVNFEEDFKLFYCKRYLDPFVKSETYATLGFSTIIQIHSFIKESVEGFDIFKTIYDYRKTYVSQKFKDAVEQAGLKSNLDFLMIWDSENPDFLDETWDTETWERVKNTPTPTFRSLDSL